MLLRPYHLMCCVEHRVSLVRLRWCLRWCSFNLSISLGNETHLGARTPGRTFVIHICNRAAASICSDLRTTPVNLSVTLIIRHTSAVPLSLETSYSDRTDCEVVDTRGRLYQARISLRKTEGVLLKLQLQQ